jgi:hypothetical protein
VPPRPQTTACFGRAAPDAWGPAGAGARKDDAGAEHGAASGAGGGGGGGDREGEESEELVRGLAEFLLSEARARARARGGGVRPG